MTLDDDLTDSARRLWSAVRAAPGDDLACSVVHALLPERGPDWLDTDLAELVAAGLLQQTGENATARFRVPDQLRSEHGGDPDILAMLSRLIEHYAVATAMAAETLEPGKFAFSDLRNRPGPGFVDRAAARAWVTTERANVLAAQRLAADLGHDDWMWQLGEWLWIPLRSDGRWNELLASQQLAADAARRLGHPYQSAALSRVCRALNRLHRYDEAADAGEEAVRIAYVVDHRWLKATAWSVLGRNAHDNGASQLALDCLDRALGEDTAPVAQGLRRRHKAEIHHARGDLADAETEARAAVELILSNPQPRHPEAARAFTVLAAILRGQGRVDDACTELLRALPLLDPHADALYLAEIHVELGEVESAAEHDAAEEHLRQAALLFDRAGHPERAAEVRQRLHDRERGDATDGDALDDSARTITTPHTPSSDPAGPEKAS